MKRRDNDIALSNLTTIRVRFSEVDSMHIVWHGQYVRYFEDGREAFGRQFVGLGYMDLYNSGYTAPMVDMTVQYKRPLRYDDTAVVETRYIATEGAKICFEYEIRRQCDGEIVATGSSVQVFVDQQGVLQLNAPRFYIEWKEKWEVK